MEPVCQHKIIIGDARHMSAIDDQTIHLVVTSPPYWQIKDYGVPGQIGFHDNYQSYINQLNLVWYEVYRLLYPGCRLCINVGDQFARANTYGRYHVLPIRTEIIRFCQTIGFDYMGAIIWQKHTTTNTSGGGSLMGSYPYPRNGIIKLDYEFILIFKKPGTAPSVSQDLKVRSKIPKDEWKICFTGHWQIPGAKQKEHLAVFPLEIPRRLIRMFSFVGDTILDPFAGSGTAQQAAAELDRNSIGYEIDESCLAYAEKRFNSLDVELNIARSKKQVNVKQRLKQLPYQFEDSNPLQKVSDPKLNNFGSKIDSTSKPRETYYRIKKIISPVRVVLNNGKSVTLLGLKSKSDKSNAAIQYLTELTRAKRVFLRFDVDHNQDYAYLYLENKTFINAHLIKNKFVDVATELKFRHKKRFLKYLNNSD